MADIGLVFDSGIKTLELSDGKGHSIEVVFNPYDTLSLGKIMETAEALDAMQTKLRDAAQNTTDWKAFYPVSKEVDADMRKAIDDLYEQPVCETLFPKQSVHALGNGFPVWANLLYAQIDQMDAGLAVEKANAQQRIRKYSEKYKK